MCSKYQESNLLRWNRFISVINLMKGNNVQYAKYQRTDYKNM